VWLIAGLIQQGDRKTAEEQYRYLVARLPSATPFEQTLIRWAGAYIDGDLANQVRHLEAALDLSPRNNILLANLAWVQGEMGDCEGALATLRPAVEARWRYPPLYGFQGACAVRVGRVDEAKKGLEAALSLTPVDPDTYGLLEAIYRFEGQDKEAEHFSTLHRTALREAPLREKSRQLAAACERLGALSLAAGRHDRARWLFQHAIASDVPSAVGHAGLSEALFGLADLEGAAREAGNALAIDPAAARAHLVLGRVADARRDAATAVREYTLFLDTSGAPPEAERVKDRIRSLRSQAAQTRD
jgi:tetratricopeptide (TPR) repeat protein